MAEDLRMGDADAGHMEGLAIALYEQLGLDPSVPVPTAALAIALLGSGAVRRGGALLQGCPSVLAWIDGAMRIVLRRRLGLEAQQHAIGHELAHLLLGRWHGDDDELEAACDYLAAALLAPLPAIGRLHRRFGWDVEAIAEELVVTQTCAALRVGEALRVPLVSIGPRVRVRGPEDYAWPPEPELRAWATHPPCGISKIPITDQPKRVVLVAA